MRVIVVGGGVAGLGSALALARAGHRVTVLERDDTPMPASADEAFDWDRRGAPQVRHSHAFLARLSNLLRDHYPDVLAELIAVGATEIRFGEALPPTMVGFEPDADDADLTMIACRRTTFEWIVRKAALAEGNVEVPTGLAVDGFLAGDPVVPGIPHVRGVHCTTGDTLEADLVIAAAGRRSVVPEWLTAIGADDVAETAEDTGIVYYTRFYRLLDGHDAPPRSGPIGGDLGYLKYGVFAGDSRTFSITLATPVADDELRRLLADPMVFDAAARQLVATAPWLDGRAEPITPKVHVMAGLLNRWRDYVRDGAPVATGFLAVGDALLCTNPLYGRGCATGFWGAQLIVEAVGAHEGDPLALAMAYDEAVREQLLPWYRSTVQQDAEARRVAAAMLAGEDPDGDEEDPRTFMRAVFRDGLVPALRTDPTVLRAFMRNFNLLTPPDALMTDADISARVLAVWSDRDNRPAEPRLGPAHRHELLALIAT
ncbi:MAG: NAD(P)/FAD-dependent oxidoreductase [Acidimicrobiia bacterium]